MSLDIRVQILVRSQPGSGGKASVALVTLERPIFLLCVLGQDVSFQGVNTEADHGALITLDWLDAVCSFVLLSFLRRLEHLVALGALQARLVRVGPFLILSLGRATIFRC
jgi:hypothetical protein